MEIQGKVKRIGETQIVGATFKKAELVVTTEEQYPQVILIEFVQDKIALMEHLQVGQDVKVSVNIRGREWVNPQGETKVFNSIQGWRIENIAAAAPKPTQAPAQSTNAEVEDPLPF